ncbi:MAG: hypothetical protein ACK2U1_25625 [Anaerolineales bacterium]|jgi:hypothetical protein
MLTTLCPECQHPIEFNAEPQIGQHTTCQSCAKEWVVIWLYPISLDSVELSDQIKSEEDV